jgi:predicted RNA-binding Zn ribbon-like protein
MVDDQFILLGDAVWLDFINTARGRTDPAPDLLTDFPAWRRWALTRKLDAGNDPAEFPAVRRFRDLLGGLAGAMDTGRPPPGAVIVTLNELLTRRGGSQQLTRVSGQWQLHFAPLRPASALEAIAHSAAVTLADQLTQVRRCGGQSCSLFFTDDSPAGSRRWCDASVCGRDVHVERRRGILR